MNFLTRGIQGWLVVVGGLALLAFVWGANQFVFKNTTAETGWPLLLGAAITIIVLIVEIRRLVTTSTDSGSYYSAPEPYRWGSQMNLSDNGGDTDGNSARKTYDSEEKFSQLRDRVGSFQE